MEGREGRKGKTIGINPSNHEEQMIDGFVLGKKISKP